MGFYIVIVGIELSDGITCTGVGSSGNEVRDGTTFTSQIVGIRTIVRSSNGLQQTRVAVLQFLACNSSRGGVERRTVNLQVVVGAVAAHTHQLVVLSLADLAGYVVSFIQWRIILLRQDDFRIVVVVFLYKQFVIGGSLRSTFVQAIAILFFHQLAGSIVGSLQEFGVAFNAVIAAVGTFEQAHAGFQSQRGIPAYPIDNRLLRQPLDGLVDVIEHVFHHHRTRVASLVQFFCIGSGEGSLIPRHITVGYHLIKVIQALEEQNLTCITLFYVIGYRRFGVVHQELVAGTDVAPRPVRTRSIVRSNVVSEADAVFIPRIDVVAIPFGLQHGVIAIWRTMSVEQFGIEIVAILLKRICLCILKELTAFNDIFGVSVKEVASLHGECQQP